MNEFVERYYMKLFDNILKKLVEKKIITEQELINIILDAQKND